MSPLLQRLITSLIAVPLVISLLWAGKELNAEWVVLGLLALITAIAAWEYANLIKQIGTAINNWSFAVICLLIVIGSGIWGIENLSITLAMAALLIVLENITHPDGLQKIIWSLFGLFYLPALISLIFSIYVSQSGFAYLVLLLTLVWAYDSGAYLTGRLIGRTKLAPAISPMKSWEGVAGGILLALAASFFSALWIDWGLNPKDVILHALALGLLVSGFAQIGDLFESKLKRAAGIKDTGALFPGHGGLLDRIDGLLFATPIYYFYLKVILHWI